MLKQSVAAAAHVVGEARHPKDMPMLSEGLVHGAASPPQLPSIFSILA